MSKGNFKVKCIDNKKNEQLYTIGKIYHIDDGYLTADTGQVFGLFLDFNSFYDWSGSEFEFVEHTTSVLDILHKCAELQAQGLNVQFSSLYQEIKLEHRDNVSCELICSFIMREVDNLEMIKAMSDYLDKLLSDCKEEK